MDLASWLAFALDGTYPQTFNESNLASLLLVALFSLHFLDIQHTVWLIMSGSDRMN